jgi:S-adenosylmethionine synthetase
MYGGFLLYYKILTSESVNIGHPDKTCDVIADSFLDRALSQDPDSQMAVECAIKNDKLFIYGEATTTADIDYQAIARRTLREIGYDNEFTIVTEISQQSPQIHSAVVQDELKANDQGMVYGYACDETEVLMPLPIMAAHKLMMAYDKFRRTTDCYFADAKSQVSVAYDKNNRPDHFDTILLSVSHSSALDLKTIQKTILEKVIMPCLEECYPQYLGQARFIINPSGCFSIWGSFSDSGCVGRKIVVDTYGGIGRNGGGCFSSKNATKVDRSGAYYARYAAKNVVSRGLAQACEIQVAYAIGQAQPVSMHIECFGTEKVDIMEIKDFVQRNFDFSPSNIIRELGLKRPIYTPTACFGHFGRPEFPWEAIKAI